jgi:hypothetical protein
MSKTYYMQHSLLLTILLCVNLIGDLSAQAFNLGIAIVDLNEERNSLNSQLFSAEHMVKVACVPYVVTHNVDDALAYSVVLFSSKMTKGTLSENLNQQITAYVENGGTLIVAGLQDEALFGLLGVDSFQLSKTRFSIDWNNELDAKEMQ